MDIVRLMRTRLHYENMPMQYKEIFKVVKNKKFPLKNFDIFLIFAQNIDCGYTLEPPRRGGSNEYPQSMFWSKNKKNRYTPANPSFTILIKVGFKGVFIARTCFPDVRFQAPMSSAWTYNFNTVICHVQFFTSSYLWLSCLLFPSRSHNIYLKLCSKFAEGLYVNPNLVLI